MNFARQVNNGSNGAVKCAVNHFFLSRANNENDKQAPNTKRNGKQQYPQQRDIKYSKQKCRKHHDAYAYGFKGEFFNGSFSNF